MAIRGRAGDLIRRHRLAAGLSQSRLARTAGVSIGVVRDLEQGRTVGLHSESVRRLGLALGLDERPAAELAAAARAGTAPPGAIVGGSGPRDLRIAVLGPVTAWHGASAVPVGPAMQRAVLGLLALHPAGFVHRTVIIDALWGDDPPARAVPIVQSYVSRLRHALGPSGHPGGPIVGVGTGYRLAVDVDQLDLALFTARVKRARRAQAAGRPAAASQAYAEALDLWRGDPLADLDILRDHPAVLRLVRHWGEVVLGYAAVATALGRPEEALPRLRDLTAREPLSEPAHAQLILTLAGCGQRTAALQAYHDLRLRLDEQLGVRPGQRVDDAYVHVLRADAPAAPSPARPGSGGRGAPVVVPRQLPAATPHFTGRAAELARLTELLDARPAASGVVISAVGGMAGVGKTALAVHWGHQTARRFPDGQLYVNLRGFDPSATPLPPSTAIRGFLDALGVPAGRIPADLDAQAALYRSLLADRSVLVVLDNARDAAQVRPLLPGAPGCLVVVTSRDPLAGLVAGVGAYPLPLEVLATADAVDLLTGRLGDRAATERRAAEEIARLCARLPLALTIAAARTAGRPGATLGTVVAELRDTHNPLDALRTGDADTDPRAVFSWSYRLLKPAAAGMFRLLGLHPGPEITAEAAACLAGTPVPRARELLAGLTDMYLLTEPAPGRYGFHDLLRAYAIDRVNAQETGADRDAARYRVLAWYLWAATAAARQLSPYRRHVHLDGPPPAAVIPTFDADTARGWLDTERANLVAVVGAASRFGAHDIAWKLPLTLWDLFNPRGFWTDWVTCLRAGLASARHLGDRAAEGWLLNHLGIALSTSGRATEAIDSLRQAVQLRRTMGDRHGEGAALGNLGRGYADIGQLPEALDCLSRALPILSETSQHAAGVCLATLSTVHRDRGELTEAMTSAHRALDIFREFGDEREQSGARTRLALASLGLGRPADAIDHASRAVELAAAGGDRLGEAEALLVLARAHGNLGDAARAWRLRRGAYAILRECEDPRAAGLLDEIGAAPGPPLEPVAGGATAGSSGTRT